MRVIIRETLERVVEVRDIDEAEEKYYNEEIILDENDFISVDFIEETSETTIHTSSSNKNCGNPSKGVKR